MAASVMVVAPHPDDAEIGMGGTIAYLRSQGVDVVIVDLTDGEPTPYGSVQIRAAETSAASKVLDIKERVQLGLKNREIFDSVENRKLLANQIRKYKPEILFAPYWQDAHPDHIQACQLAEGARFYSKFVKGDLLHEPHYPKKLIHYFSTHIRPRFDPSFTFDISNHIDLKIRALECYASQFSSHPNNVRVFEMVRTEAAYWGQRTQCIYAEPFVCKETIRLASVDSLLAV